MVPTVRVIVDDQDEGIEYLCPVTKQTVSGTYYNNTWTTIASDDCANGWFEYTFNGTDLRITTTSLHANQNYSVKVDSGPPIKNGSNAGYFQSPKLADRQHKVTYSTGAVDLLPAFDYLTFAAGETTHLGGQTIIVDDVDDSSMSFGGTWTTQQPSWLSPSNFHERTMHWSSQVGDTLVFQFTGRSISVIGALTNISAASSNITATYAIDGAIAATHSIPNNTLEGLSWTELFHGDLQPGTHTLVVNITEISPPQAFGIDAILYNASFPNLAALPGYTSTSTPTWSDRTSINGVIAGCVVAGVALISVFCFVITWRNRRRARVGPCSTRQDAEGRWFVVNLGKSQAASTPVGGYPGMKGS